MSPNPAWNTIAKNKECGETEEEFILFLFQGVGLNFDEVRDHILIGELEMTETQANEIMKEYGEMK